MAPRPGSTGGYRTGHGDVRPVGRECLGTVIGRGDGCKTGHGLRSGFSCLTHDLVCGLTVATNTRGSLAPPNPYVETIRSFVS